MVPLDKDLVVIAGRSCTGGCSFESSLYLLSCHNKACGWTSMSQTLQVARQQFVAMLIPDDLTDCSKKLSNIYLKIKTFSNNLLVHSGPKLGNFWHDDIVFKIQIYRYVRQLHEMGIFKIFESCAPMQLFFAVSKISKIKKNPINSYRLKRTSSSSSDPAKCVDMAIQCLRPQLPPCE